MHAWNNNFQSLHCNFLLFVVIASVRLSYRRLTYFSHIRFIMISFFVTFYQQSPNTEKFAVKKSSFFWVLGKIEWVFRVKKMYQVIHSHTQRLSIHRVKFVRRCRCRKRMNDGNCLHVKKFLTARWTTLA